MLFCNANTPGSTYVAELQAVEYMETCFQVRAAAECRFLEMSNSFCHSFKHSLLDQWVANGASGGGANPLRVDLFSGSTVRRHVGYSKSSAAVAAAAQVAEAATPPAAGALSTCREALVPHGCCRYSGAGSEPDISVVSRRQPRGPAAMSTTRAYPWPRSWF